MSVSTVITEGFIGVSNPWIVAEGFGATGGGSPPEVLTEPTNENGFLGHMTRITSTRVITVIRYGRLDELAPAT